MSARPELKEARRVVVKIGSALLADPGDPFARFAAQVALLRERGLSVTLVSSGAIALGFPALGLTQRQKISRACKPRQPLDSQSSCGAGARRFMHMAWQSLRSC